MGILIFYFVVFNIVVPIIALDAGMFKSKTGFVLAIIIPFWFSAYVLTWKILINGVIGIIKNMREGFKKLK